MVQGKDTASCDALPCACHTEETRSYQPAWPLLDIRVEQSEIYSTIPLFPVIHKPRGAVSSHWQMFPAQPMASLISHPKPKMCIVWLHSSAVGTFTACHPRWPCQHGVGERVGISGRMKHWEKATNIQEPKSLQGILASSHLNEASPTTSSSCCCQVQRRAVFHQAQLKKRIKATDQDWDLAGQSAE